MPLRFNYCPHCNEHITFRIENTDIDQDFYPAPVYMICNHCDKLSTFYVDSNLRVSYKELEKKPGGKSTITASK